MLCSRVLFLRKFSVAGSGRAPRPRTLWACFSGSLPPFAPTTELLCFSCTSARSGLPSWALSRFRSFRSLWSCCRSFCWFRRYCLAMPSVRCRGELRGRTYVGAYARSVVSSRGRRGSPRCIDARSARRRSIRAGIRMSRMIWRPARKGRRIWRRTTLDEMSGFGPYHAARADRPLCMYWKHVSVPYGRSDRTHGS